MSYSSTSFSIAMFKMPKIIDLSLIKEAYEKIDNIDQFTANILHKDFRLSIEDTDLSNEIKEDDLYELGTEELKIKKAAIIFLRKAIDTILMPIIGINGSYPVIEASTYISIDGITYIIAGGESRYSYPSDTFNYIKAINMSSILTLK